MIPNKTRKIKRLLVLTLLGIASLSYGKGTDMPPMDMGGAPPSEEQRACMEKKIGKPDRGSMPSREKMEAAMKECSEQKPEEQSDFKVLQDKQNKVFSLDGKIPAACKEKISVSTACSVEDNKISFLINEIAKDDFQCLKQNKTKCEDKANANECLSFEQLTKDIQLQSKFAYKIDFKNTKEACAKIKTESVQVSIVKNGFNEEKGKTESSNCIECRELKNQIGKLQDQIKQLQSTMEKQAKMPRPSDMPDRSDKKMSKMKFPPKRDDLEEVDDDEDMPRPRRMARSSQLEMNGPMRNTNTMAMNGFGMSYNSNMFTSNSSMYSPSLFRNSQFGGYNNYSRYSLTSPSYGYSYGTSSNLLAMTSSLLQRYLYNNRYIR